NTLVFIKSAEHDYVHLPHLTLHRHALFQVLDQAGIGAAIIQAVARRGRGLAQENLIREEAVVALSSFQGAVDEEARAGHSDHCLRLMLAKVWKDKGTAVLLALQGETLPNLIISLQRRFDLVFHSQKETIAAWKATEHNATRD